MTFLTDYLRNSCEASPDKIALRDGGGEYRYSELYSAALRYAASLDSLGIKKGDRILFALPNNKDFVVTHFGNLFHGAISVPCEHSAKPDFIQRIIRDCNPKIVIGDKNSVANISAAEFSANTKVYCWDPCNTANTGQPEGLREIVEAHAESAPKKLDDNATAVLLYTTGTTGSPKGVTLTHRNTTSTIDRICQFIGYTSEDHEVVTLPISHSFGLGHVYCNFKSGGSVYLADGFQKIGRVLKEIQSSQATGFPGTPLGYGILIENYAEVLKSRCQSLRFAVINSAPMPPEKTAKLQEILPELDIMVYYGSTEASRTTFASLTKLGPGKYRSVGKPLSHYSVEIVDEQLNPVEPGVEGQITVSGQGVSAGYWGEQSMDETNEKFRNGKYLTGDIGRFDSEGNLYCTGRIKDIINVGGLKVSPIEIERALQDIIHDEYAIVGIPDDNGSDSVVLCINKGDTEYNLESIQSTALKSLERWKVPGRIVYLDEIPKTATGKIQRSRISQSLKGNNLHA